MVANIFQTIGQAISSFTTALSSALEGITGMFYDTDGLTTLGVLLLIGVGVGVVYWVFGLIRGLISQRRA